MPFVATWMDLEIVILIEVRERRGNIIRHPLYVEFRKKLYRGTYKTETDSQTWKTNLGCRGEG